MSVPVIQRHNFVIQAMPDMVKVEVGGPLVQWILNLIEFVVWEMNKETVGSHHG